MTDDTKKGVKAAAVLLLLLAAMILYRPRDAGLSLLLVGGAVWLGISLLRSKPKRPSPFGSSSWATPAEIARFNRARGGDVGLGTVITPAADDDWMMHDDFQEHGPLRWQTDKHVMLIGATRAGKGATVIVPQLLTYQGSVFVIDPKGENATITAPWRAKLDGGNAKIAILDPFGDVRGEAARYRVRYNPLRRLMASPRMMAEASVLAEALVSGEKNHWYDSARQIMASIILHVVTAEGRTRRDLVEVMRIANRDPDLIAAELSKNRALGGIIRETAGRLAAIEPGERSSILSSLRSGTNALNDPYIREVLRDDGPQLDFREFRNGTLSVYVCLKGTLMTTYSAWLRVITAAALDTMTDELDPPPLPVQFIIDEASSLGHFEAIELASTFSAGYGIQLWTVWHNWEQLRKNYAKAPGTFWGNAGIRYCFSAEDNETAEYISKSLGVRTVTTLGTSEPQAGGGSVSTGQASAPLLDPAAVARMPQVPILHSAVSLSGCKPCYVLLRPYFEMPELLAKAVNPKAAQPVPVELSEPSQNEDDDDEPAPEPPRRPRPRGFRSGKAG